MPGEQGEELEMISEKTGLPIAVLLRQGAVRIIQEFRDQGLVSSRALEAREEQPA
jgi:hypothetical protein